MTKTAGMNRRNFLCGFGTATLAAGMGLTPAHASLTPRALSFYNIHTGEKLSPTTYWDGTGLIPDALGEINRFLRDWRTGEVAEMNLDLLNLLSQLHGMMDSPEPFHLISGYRSPKTNASLRGKSTGVAKKSLHMRAMAADIVLPGRDLGQLHKAAVSLKRGGVGRYSKTGFIHVDVGRVRYWGS